MRVRSLALAWACFAAMCTLASSGHAQVKRRIAVFPFDDRTTADKDMNIGMKVADLLIAKLTANGAFTVLDRQYVDRILAEKNLKYDPNYDSAAAAKTGLMGTVDMVVSGQIDAFNANTSQSTTGKLLAKRVETDGLVDLKVTARLISVEKGSIVIAPSSNTEQKGVLSKNDKVAPLVTNHLPGGKEMLGMDQDQSTANAEQALRKLVDKAADEVTKQLSTELAQSAMSLPIEPEPAHASPKSIEPAVAAHSSSSGSKPAFVGINEGQAFIDKGSDAGIKVGDKFIIRRSNDTGLKDGAGQPIMRHKPVCTLTIASVEEASAAGKCVPGQAVRGPEGVPQTGDEVVAAK